MNNNYYLAHLDIKTGIKRHYVTAFVDHEHAIKSAQEDVDKREADFICIWQIKKHGETGYPIFVGFVWPEAISETLGTMFEVL